MLNYQRPNFIANTNNDIRETHRQEYDQHQDQEHDHEDDQVRDIHALTPPRPNSNRSISTSLSIASSENFSTMSREFNALVLAGSSINNNHGSDHNTEGNSTINSSNNNNSNNLGRIGEDETILEETNPLAIVPDNASYPLNNNNISMNPSPRDDMNHLAIGGSHVGEQVNTIQRVKKEEVESKISAWQNAKISKINNRFKREDAVINGWESEEVQKATSWMKKVERKLEEKRAKALEKMQNDIAKAHRKAEERRASAEAKRGTKVAKVLEIANLMKAVGRAPAKRSFF